MRILWPKECSTYTTLTIFSQHRRLLLSLTLALVTQSSSSVLELLKKYLFQADLTLTGPKQGQHHLI